MIRNANLSEGNRIEQLLSMNERMEALAIAGEWAQVAAKMIERNTLLQSVDGPEREAALVAARRTTLRVQHLAEGARKEVGEKLSELQRGKRATDSYMAHA